MASRGWTLGFWALVLVLPGGLLLLPLWLLRRRRQQLAAGVAGQPLTAPATVANIAPHV